jgi:hypothetical protein
MSNLWLIIRPHFFWLAVIAIGALAFHEHEQAAQAIAAADAVTRTSQQAIMALEQQIAARTSAAQKADAVIITQQRMVRTPVQAVSALPDVSALPVAIRAMPSGPDYVLPAPDLVPLYQTLADGRKCAIDLAACAGNYHDQQAINVQQALEVQAWKKAARGTFWRNAWKALKIAVPVAVTGYLIGRAHP